MRFGCVAFEGSMVEVGSVGTEKDIDCGAESSCSFDDRNKQVTLVTVSVSVIADLFFSLACFASHEGLRSRRDMEALLPRKGETMPISTKDFWPMRGKLMMSMSGTSLVEMEFSFAMRCWDDNGPLRILETPSYCIANNVVCVCVCVCVCVWR